MDKLKEYITRHRAEFESDRLPEGHLDRFRTKLESGRLPWEPVREKTMSAPDDRPERAELTAGRKILPSRRRPWGLWLSFAAAAAVAVVCLLRLPGGTSLPSAPPAQAETQTCQAREEFEELRIYYTMQINDMMAQIRELYKEEKTPGGAELLKETKKVLHDNYMFEETVLPTLPCSNKGLYAMNQHYSNSLESLSIMLREMERMNTETKE